MQVVYNAIEYVSLGKGPKSGRQLTNEKAITTNRYREALSQGVKDLEPSSKNIVRSYVEDFALDLERLKYVVRVLPDRK